MADKTRLIWANGSTIKQGDTASVFKLKLKTEDDAELNGTAKLQLIDSNKAKIEYNVDIVDNIVEFKLDRVLPADVYIVEVEHAGYVFPSADLVTLKVTENQGDNITDEIVGLLSIDEYIKQKLADFQSGQIDLDELASKLTIPRYDDSPIKAQISEILAEIESLKQSEYNQTSYDDTELREQIKALSEHVDSDTVYDDSEIKSRLSSLESKPDNDTVYDDSELKREIENLKAGQAYDDSSLIARIERLESLGGGSNAPRYGPTGWFLDRSVSPWQFRFDNGSSLTLGNVDQRAYIYSESAPLTVDKLSEYRIVLSLMRTANGSVPISSWASANTIARFWGGAEVTNPVNDASLFDFSKAMYNPNDTSGPSKRSQPILIRCYYELGVFTEEDILSFGVVKL